MCSLDKRVCVTVLALTMFLFPWVCWAQEEAEKNPSQSEALTQLQKITPTGASFFLKCSGTDQLLEKGKSLDLVRLWNDPEVKDFFSQAVSEGLQELEEGAYPDLPLNEIWKLCCGEIFLTGEINYGEILKGNKPDFAIGVNISKNRETFLPKLKGMLDDLAWAKTLVKENSTYREFSVHTVFDPRTHHSFSYVVLDDLLVGSLGREYLQSMIDIHLDNKPGLAQDEVFNRCLSKVGASGHDLFTYIKFNTLVEVLSAILNKDVGKFMEAFGLGSVNAICCASNISGGGSRDVMYLDYPGEKQGLIKAITPQAVSFETVHMTPPDALFFTGFALDPDVYLNELENLMQGAFPIEYEAFRAGLQMADVMTGMDFKDEILASLGSEFSFFVRMPSSGGVFPDFYLTVTIDDREAYQKVQTQLIEVIKRFTDVVESSFGENTLYHVDLQDQSSPMSPCFCLTEKRLVISSTPRSMKTHLRWVGKDQEGLEGCESFTDAMITAPEDASMLLFINFPKAVEIGYGMGAPFLTPILSRPDVPFDPALLPMTDTVKKYISCDSGYFRSDDAGLVLCFNRPLGMGALVSMVASILDYVVDKNLTRDLVTQLFGAEAPVQQMAGLSRATVDLELNEAYSLKLEGNFTDAEQHLTEWLNVNPRSPLLLWAIRTRGDCRFEMKKYKQAIEDYLAVIEGDPSIQSVVYHDIARAYAKMGDADKTVDYLEKAIVNGHRAFGVHEDLAGLVENERFYAVMDVFISVCKMRLDGENEETANYLTDWIMNNPYHALTGWALKSRGDCWLELDRKRDAIDDYEKAAGKDLGLRAPVFYNIACLHARLGEPDEALEYLKKSIAAGFDDFEMMDNDGDLDEVRGDGKYKALRWEL